MTDFTYQRRQMIEQQLRRRGVTDADVLAAMERVPRERFVPPELRDRAYADSALSIGASQTISQPYIVGLSTQALAVSPDHRVLEVGTGSGYQTAVLAELGAEIFTVERLKTLSLRARAILDSLGFERIHYRVGDGSLGLPDDAPFDRIVVTAMAPGLPPSLFAQLREGGRMVIPIGDMECQTLDLITKSRGQPMTEKLCGCLFVKLVGEEGWRDPADATDREP
jgi:protein-L-isoaspartate(D-aspartate) O-methyltransferase